MLDSCQEDKNDICLRFKLRNQKGSVKILEGLSGSNDMVWNRIKQPSNEINIGHE